MRVLSTLPLLASLATARLCAYPGQQAVCTPEAGNTVCRVRDITVTWTGPVAPAEEGVLVIEAGASADANPELWMTVAYNTDEIFYVVKPGTHRREANSVFGVELCVIDGF